MKRLTLVACLFVSFLTANAQKHADDSNPHFSIYDAGIFDGRTYYEGFNLGKPAGYKGMLPANSAALTTNTNSMLDVSSRYADWISNSNNYSLSGFVTFRLNTGKVQPKARHLFSVGINYMQGGVIFKDFAENKAIRTDTVFGPNQETYAFVDSVNTRSFSFTGEHNKLLINLDYQVATNPKTKLGASIGFGIGMGFTVVNTYEASATNGYSKYMVNPGMYYDYTYYDTYGTINIGGQNNNVFFETGKTRAAFVLRPYIPLTLSYRLSNKSDFLKKVTVFGMFKVGREFMAWGNGTKASSLFHERSIGLRYSINKVQKIAKS